VNVYSLLGRDVRTKTVQDTVNPLFYEVKHIIYSYDDINDAPPIVLNVWDEDDGLFDSTTDYMGSAVIYLKDAHVHN